MIKTSIAVFAIAAALAATSCGKTEPTKPTATTAVETTAAETAGQTSETEEAETKGPDAETATPTEAAGTDSAEGPYINDGTIEGTYQLYSFMGMPLQEFAEMSGTDMETAAKSMQFTLNKDGKVNILIEGEGPENADYTIDGDSITLESEGEKMSGTLKDGLLTINMEGEEVVFARLTEAAFAVPDHGEAKVWTGTYTKFVGDEAQNTEGSFSLDLYDDGTGIHHRDDLDIKVTWALSGSDFTMTENFMGITLDYTGTMDGNTLTLYNGDPEDEMTCMYVYQMAE